MSFYLIMSNLLHIRLNKVLDKINIKKCKKIVSEKYIYYCYKDVVELLEYDDKKNYDRKVLENKYEQYFTYILSDIIEHDNGPFLHIIDGKVDETYVCDYYEEYLDTEGLFYLLLKSHNKKCNRFQKTVSNSILGNVYIEMSKMFNKIKYNKQEHGETWKNPLELFNECIENQLVDDSCSDTDEDYDDGYFE